MKGRLAWSRAVVAAALWCAGCGGAEPARPNVILITVDTLRADHLTAYGYGRDTSPFLTELFADGTRFAHAISQCGTTPQSLSSMMTGLFPFTDRILTTNGRFTFLRQDNRTLAQAFQEAGYETHAVTSQIQAAEVTGIDLGFESFDGVRFGPDKKQERNRRADEMTDRALAWLRERDPSRPYFLWLHYLDPHFPYKPPERYDGFWEDEEPSGEGVTRTFRFDPKGSLDHPVSEGELARIVLRYDREVRFLDDELRRLFAEGFGDELPNAVVAFSADHGEALGDHGMIGHNDLFEEILNVPLLVRTPEPLGATVPAVETPVMLVDLYPTLLELARIPLRTTLRGRSLVPQMRDAAHLPEAGRILLAEYPAKQAVYRGPFKLYGRKQDGWQGPLFDLRQGETRDVSRPRAGVMAELIEESVALRAAPLGPQGARATSAGDAMPSVTPEMLEELEALGYGGDGR